MPKKIIILSFLVSLTLLIVTTFFNASPTKSATAEHVVISEIQTRGDNGASDEFVELYNPTDSPVSLSGWSMARIAAGGTDETNFVSPIVEGTIPSNGYYLIARSSASTPGYNGSMTSDLTYGSSLADNTTILLYDNSDPKVLIDKVGMGENTMPEASPAPQLVAEDPPVDKSIERKACPASTSESMISGDSNNGNSEDSNNNASDFVLRGVSDPKNSQSGTETTSCQEETPTNSPTLTPTGEVTVTPTPTSEPTATLTPTPTTEVTSTPTPTTELTVTPTPTEEPTPSPVPTTKLFIGGFYFPGRVSKCYLEYKAYGFGFLKFFFPKITCHR